MAINKHLSFSYPQRGIGGVGHNQSGGKGNLQKIRSGNVLARLDGDFNAHHDFLHQCLNVWNCESQ